MNQVAEIQPKDDGREIAPVSIATMTPMDMIRHAVASGAGVDMIDKLMTLQERWEKHQGRKAFDAAIADAKAEMPVILKSREVDFTSPKGRTHYRYEDLAQIAKTIDPILTQHGLSYRFRTTQDGPTITVTCILAHKDGHCEETSLSAGRDETGNKNNHQAVASAVTYLQRYTLKAALGLAASDDDDGGLSESVTKEFINMEQIEQIETMLADTSSDVAKFCQSMHVKALADITLKQFPDAIAKIERKRREMTNAAAQ